MVHRAARGRSALAAVGVGSPARAGPFSRGIAPLFFRSVLANPGMAGLLLDRRLQPDAKLLEAWTSQESWQPGRDVARQVTSLLLMPDVSDTTRHLPCLDGPDGSVPLGAGDLHASAMSAQGPLCVVCWSEAMASRLAPVVDWCSAAILRLGPGTALTRLVTAASRLGAAHLAIWEPGAALLPASLMQRLCDHHCRQDNDVTRIDALPEGAGVEVFTTSCLHRFKAEAAANADFAPGRFLEWALSVERLPLCFEDLRRNAWPESMPSDLPKRVTIASARDWARLSDAVTEARTRSDGIRGVRFAPGSTPTGGLPASDKEPGGPARPRGCCS